jgi:xylulokinase
LEDVQALAVGGQQHGMVTLDESGELVRDALLWNDNRSAQDATDLIAELGGPEAWADAVGSVCRIHDSVEDSLAGPLRAGQCRPDNRYGPSPRLADLAHRRPVVRTRYRPRRRVGTCYFDASANAYRSDLIELGIGHDLAVPRVAAPH